MIEAQDIRLARGVRTILDGVSLNARAGDLVAVIGPNGAGKSSLLATLAGLLAPDSGAVRLDGKPLTEFSHGELARRRAYLPQNPHLEWPLSVERLVALGLTPHLPALGPLPARFAPAIARVLDACDLSDRRDQPATTLSGGEFARAMLARALVGEPALLVVDEPIFGLDPRHAMTVMRLLSAEAARGRLVIASLHDLTLAARHTTHILALREGRVLVAGNTASVFSPALIHALFDVEAELRGEGANMTVDFTHP